MIRIQDKPLAPSTRLVLFYVLWVFCPIVATTGHWFAFWLERNMRMQTHIEQNSKHLHVYVDAVHKLMQDSSNYETIPLAGMTSFQTLDVFLVATDNKFITRPRFAHRGDFLVKTALMYAAEQSTGVVTGLDTSYRFTPCVRAATSVTTTAGPALLIAELDMREVAAQPWYFIWDEVLSTICSVIFLIIGFKVFKPYILIAEAPDRNLQEVLQTLQSVTQSFNAAELRQAFRAMPFIAVILDEELRILFMSDLAGRAMGTAEGAALNSPFDVFLPNTCRDDYMSQIVSFVRSDKTVQTFPVDWPPSVTTVTISKVKSAHRTLLVLVAS
jgi:PAS domain-containing protein